MNYLYSKQFCPTTNESFNFCYPKMLGELPIEASLHLGVLALSNPGTKAFEVVKYLLKMADNSSLTWSVHVRLLCQLYSLPDPLALMSTPPWPKERWKSHTRVAVTSYYENLLRQRAAQKKKAPVSKRTDARTLSQASPSCGLGSDYSRCDYYSTTHQNPIRGLSLLLQPCT